MVTRCERAYLPAYPLTLLCVVFSYVFVTFPCGVLSRVLLLIVSILDLCLLSYFFYKWLLGRLHALTEHLLLEPSTVSEVCYQSLCATYAFWKIFCTKTERKPAHGTVRKRHWALAKLGKTLGTSPQIRDPTKSDNNENKTLAKISKFTVHQVSMGEFPNGWRCTFKIWISWKQETQIIIKGYFHLCPRMDFLQTLHINNSLYTNYENVFIELDS